MGEEIGEKMRRVYQQYEYLKASLEEAIECAEAIPCLVTDEQAELPELVLRCNILLGELEVALYAKYIVPVVTENVSCYE
jgi:hypothetical protein